MESRTAAELDSDHNRDQTSTSDDSGILLTWQVHLARQRPRQAAAAAGFILLAALSVAAWRQNAFWPLLTLAVLFLSLNDFFLPVRYVIDRDGVKARGLVSQTALDWERVRRLYVGPRGLKVSPLPHPGRLEAYRGVFLHCSGEIRERAVQIIQQQLDRRSAAAEAL